MQAIFNAPAHPDTRALLNSMPGQTQGQHRLIKIKGASPNPADPPKGCPFQPRCERTEPVCAQSDPAIVFLAQKPPGRLSGAATTPAQELMGLHKTYMIKGQGGLFPKPMPHPLVRNASLTLAPNSILGLVGESGSGKTTIDMMVLWLVEPTPE